MAFVRAPERNIIRHLIDRHFQNWLKIKYFDKIDEYYKLDKIIDEIDKTNLMIFTKSTKLSTSRKNSMKSTKTDEFY